MKTRIPVAIMLGLVGLARLVGGASAVSSLKSVDPLASPPPTLGGELLAVALETGAPEQRITPGLRLRMASSSGDVKVIILLREPLIASSLAPGSEAWDEDRARHLAVLQHQFVDRAKLLGLKALRGMSHLPVVVAQVPADRIAQIAADPLVRAVEEDITLSAQRVEGAALIRADQLRNLGGRGSGKGVAVIDSGIDSSHAELSGRVTAQKDYTETTGDGTVDDNGHGTECAGIVAGSSGGMAPQAHLWALKVLDASGHGDLSLSVSALNDVYGYRTEPSFGGVHVVSMSLGASAIFDAACDDQMPSMGAAMDQLFGVGIPIFVASGNDGCTNGVGFPACVNRAIAVGAVYDSNVGPRGTFIGECIPESGGGCNDLSTQADQITCYTNSGNRLDILAPSDCARTTRTSAKGGGYEDCFNGTSAATPYAAGVAAQILSLRPATTVTELKGALMSTGPLVTDPRNGVTRHRVDALAAYQSLTGGGCTAPGAPSNLRTSASSVTSGQSYTISWNAGSSADSYELQEATSASFAGATTLAGAGTSSTRSHSVTANTTYYYRARALRGCGAQSAYTATVSVTVSAGGTGGGSVYWAAVASRANGVGTSQWRSDLGVLNLSGAAATVTIKIHVGASVAAQGQASVPAGAQAIFVDILGPLQLNLSGSGSVEVVSTKPVIVTSRTYNQSSAGTFGQSYDGYTAATGLGSGSTSYLPQLVENAFYRTNIGLTNMGTATASVRVTLYNASGSSLTNYTVSLAPGELKQETQPFRKKASQTNMGAGYAKIEVLSGSGIIAYASLIDVGTNDPTTITPRQ